MDTTTSGRRRARAAAQPKDDRSKGNRSGAGRSSAQLSAAAKKAWETRRAHGWKHPRAVRPLTAKEIAVASGVPVAKVQRILELATKRIPASTPPGKGR